MAKLKEVFAIEDSREQKGEWNTIHLFKMGGFLEAYDWSAWLISQVTFNDDVRTQTKDRTPIKVRRHKRTDIEGTYCTVGFPATSLDKYIPERTDFKMDGEAHCIATVTLPPSTIDDMRKQYTDWVNAQPIEGPREKKQKPHAADAAAEPAQATQTAQTAQSTQQIPAKAGILSQIMAYPLSDSTPADNAAFIASLKQQIADIL